MLARVAENLYWFGRYLKRADNVARLADVQFRDNLERTALRGTMAWDAVIAALGADHAFRTAATLDPDLTPEAFVVTSTAHATSLRSTVGRARTIARELREQLPREVFEEVNSLYLYPERCPALELQPYCAVVKRSVAAVLGLYAHSELVTEGNHWFHFGVALEAADMAGRLVDTKYFVLLPSAADVGGPLDRYQWTALLRSVSAMDAYRQRYSAPPSAERVVQLLLFDPNFPRSLVASARALKRHFEALASQVAPEGRTALERSILALHAELEAMDGCQAIERGLHEQLEHFRARLVDVDGALGRHIFRSSAEAVAA